MNKMSDINTDGMAIAPGVIETIVILAVRDVPGVDSVGAAPSGIRSLLAFKQSTQGVVVTVDDDDTVQVEVTIRILSGYSLDEIASQVREAVADAILSQVGLKVSRVDIKVDGIHFQD
ncbi:MAG: Asp23/Gls24 family envelope stress response protein [Eggerthellaceae bacterium]